GMGGGTDDGELATRMKLRARAGAALGPVADDVLPYLGLLLGLRLDPDREGEFRAMPADELSSRERDAFVTGGETVASQRPLVIAVDDLHWANVETREVAE